MSTVYVSRDARELHLSAIAAGFDRGGLRGVGEAESIAAYNRLWRACNKWQDKATTAAGGAEVARVAEWSAQVAARAAWNAVPGRAPWVFLVLVPGRGIVLERMNRPTAPRVAVGRWVS